MITIPLVYNLPDEINGTVIRHDSDFLSVVIATEKTWRIDDYLPSSYQVKELAGVGIRSVAAVPLRVRGRTIGVLWVAALKPGLVFSEYDIVLLESVGGQAAVAIDNTDLFDQQRFISESLQRGFLPEHLPEVKNTDIAVFYASATIAAVVGGDLYDVLPLDNGDISFVVGDVSGKGVEATSYAAMVKYTLRASAFQNPDPSQVLTVANSVICRQLPPGHFITLVYGLYEPSQGNLRIGIAGHPYPLLYSAEEKSVTSLTGHNDPAFTIYSEYEYQETEYLLAPGDLLVLYTDGIIELRREGEFFGEKGLADLVKKYADLTAQEIADRIIADAREFAHGRLTDDIVLMVIKRTGK